MNHNANLVERAKEIIASGCGCDRLCEAIGPDDCSCEEDARKIVALVLAELPGARL